MRPFLLLPLLTLCACSAQPGAGSQARSGLLIPDIYKAADVTTDMQTCAPAVCVARTRISPDVMQKRLNLSAFSPDRSLAALGTVSAMAGSFRIELTPAQGEWMMNVYVPDMQ